ncbi:MAG: phytanoyl-CoA dioxygenase family protein [Robiginitomaculum sp.]|nr:phytanoyl-CoA dioxygenase family protein [Robiginitomaculum sp.]
MNKLHPLNTDFTWQDRPLNNLRGLNKQQVRQFNQQGFCILPKAVPSEILQEILRIIDPLERAGGGSELLDANGEKLSSYDANELTFTCNLVASSDYMADFYRSQLFANITHDLIGGQCRLYWDQAVYKHPQKGGEFPYHQDNGYTFVRPQAYLTCWLALSDAPIKAGCPWVIPDAHLGGTYQHNNKPAGLEIENVQNLINLHGETPAPVTAGDMVIFSSLTPHKTGANLSKHIRKALIIQFIPDGAVCITTDGEEKLNDKLLHQAVI